MAARTSSFALKGKSLDISEIGERLKVRTVLEGSVRRVNQRVRITAQLINAADGYHLWSERYDRDLEDVFAIQDEIARTIVDCLKVKLTTAESQAFGKRQTENLEAYELYLRGRHCWNKWHLQGMMQKAMHYYEEALAKDPEYALAHHGLADAYSILGLYAFAPATEVMPKARESAFRAVELAPELAETRTSLGFVRCSEGLESGRLDASSGDRYQPALCPGEDVSFVAADDPRAPLRGAGGGPTRPEPRPAGPGRKWSFRPRLL